ncbi:hypothetical protein SHZ00_000681 [Campylobacter jejuni]|uniref:hypothetical protein n=1 Tax=Campylobacter jejuni TaxID=197 RepID=UPI000458A9D8|nr:hypothetical protein [Campylobacter jejuni]EAJ7128375.1 hypothetical protein [Campylobacter jejuni]EAK7824456.1 hypothetical protein [Campylobacter jejuni]EAK8337306.1 hypothetical protein [Campylobacter jejuni]EAK8771311.1 hypothetical protein [Campylobacter jejuni]EAK8815200.1 hypothetical protein [Campylobacter jejuni]
MGIVTSTRKYKNTLSKNVTILEGKKHFWDIKFKIKVRVYPSFKQHLITFLGQSGHFGIFGIFYALD